MSHKISLVISLVMVTLMHARSYEDEFQAFGRRLDRMHELWNNAITELSDVESVGTQQAFSLEKTNNAVVITVDTGSKVSADDIDITHKAAVVDVNVKSKTSSLALKLQQLNNSHFSIKLCSSEESKEAKDGSAYHYAGSSCMQQAMHATVNLADVTAEYRGTQLVLTVPLQAPEVSKKIPVTVKSEPAQVIQQPEPPTPAIIIDEK